MPGIRSIGGTGGSSTSVTAQTIPATSVAGDVAYFVIVQGGGQTITQSASNGGTWSTSSALQAWNSTTSRTTIYKKVLTAADCTGSVTVGATFAGSQIWSAALFIVQDANDATTVISAPLVKSTSSTTDTFNPVTPPAPGSLVVCVDGGHLSASNATAMTHTTPSGYTALVDISQSGTIQHTGLAVWTRQMGNSVASETPGSVTVSPAAAREMALVFAFPPAQRESWGMLAA